MQVIDFRLSCIWSEGVRDAFGAASCGRLDALMRPDLYAPLFNTIVEAGSDPLLTVPWPPSPRDLFPLSNAFWRKYVLNKLRGSPAANRGKEAFSALVPFKRKTPLVRLQRKERCFVESWYHPHGIVLIATAWFRGSYDAGALEDAVRSFTHDRSAATWFDGAQESAKLDDIAADGLDRLREEAFGHVGPGFRSDPLRILTVVSVQSGQDEDTGPGLRAIAKSAGSAVGGQFVGTPDDPPADIQILTKGRVICNPAKAASSRGKTHTLGCLHRNVTVATAQVASLLSGAEAALAALVQANNTMYPRVENYLEQLARQLEVIYIGSARSTYTQLCVQSQAREAKDLINRLRDVIPLARLS
ncbi:MAG: hypothetical protein ABSC06_11920 [Rhodopila sp.]|jgi:hypothetical protein